MRSLFCLCIFLQSATISHAFVSGRGRISPTRTCSVATSAVVETTGAGPVQADMNQYNIPLEEIAQQWTANLIAANALQEEGIFLGAKDSKRLFVDTIKVEIPRVPGKGVGLELLEIAGGRSDGLGITIVSGFVEGGITTGCGILEGDSIIKVAVRKTAKTQSGDNMLEEMEQEIALSTECYGFDKTVEAIGSLPPAEADDGSEMLCLTLKRVRKKPKITVNLQYPPSQNEPDVKLELFSGENLRRAFLVRGIKLNDALSRRFDSGGTGDCGAEGTCATCVVSIVRGDALINPIGQQEEQILVKNPRWRMACKTIVGYGMQEGEMTVRVNPRQWAD